MPRRKFNGIAGLSVLDDSGTRCPGCDNQISSQMLPAGLQKETPPQPRTTDVSEALAGLSVAALGQETGLRLLGVPASLMPSLQG